MTLTTELLKEIEELNNQEYCDENRIKDLIVRHKGIIGKMTRLLQENENDQTMFNPAVETAKEISICLYIQRNGKNDLKNLQIHHLIERPIKNIMPFHQYAPQRHYFANQIVIKQKDHKHNTSPEFVITDEKIKYVLNKYFTNPKINELKSELRGRLDALKEEVENLQKLGLIKIKRCSCFEHELMNDTYDLVYKRLASIQEEIKLIETAGVGK